jgi:hypothetical protein
MSILSGPPSSSTKVMVSWYANYGIHFQLQGRTNLVEGEWNDIGDPVMGSGEWISATTTATEVSGFYRVEHE